MQAPYPWAKTASGFYIGCPVCQRDYSESRCKPWNDNRERWPERLQAKSIPNELFVDAVNEAIERRGRKWATATRWDVAAVLAGHPELVATGPGTWDFPAAPAKVVLAKAKRLILRGVLDGCFCGCRGDFEPMGRLAGLVESKTPRT